MKKIISFYLLCSVIVIKAQFAFNFVNTPTVLPVNPATSSNIKIASKVGLPNIGSKISSVYQIDMLNNKVTLKNSYCDGSLTSGVTIFDTVQIGNLTAGVWQLTYKAFYGNSVFTNCNSSDSVIKSITFTVTTKTFIDEKIGNKSLLVYPTIFTNSLNISYLGNMPFKPIKLNIYNTLGQIILTEDLQSQMTAINLEGLTKGVYYINVFYDNEVFCDKIIKQ